MLQSFDPGTADLMMKGQSDGVMQMMKDVRIKINWADHFPGIADYCNSANGKKFLMPVNAATAVMYCNTDDLASVNMAPPARWAELDATRKAPGGRNRLVARHVAGPRRPKCPRGSSFGGLANAQRLFQHQLDCRTDGGAAVDKRDGAGHSSGLRPVPRHRAQGAMDMTA